MKPLLRLLGIAEELLVSARSGIEPQKDGALGTQLNAVMQEVHAVLPEGEPSLADEFKRLVLGGAGEKAGAEIRAATLVGWLKAALGAESVETNESELASSEEPPRRKQTVGFKIRSPVVRETTSSAPPEGSSG